MLINIEKVIVIFKIQLKLYNFCNKNTKVIIIKHTKNMLQYFRFTSLTF